MKYRNLAVLILATVVSSVSFAARMAPRATSSGPSGVQFGLSATMLNTTDNPAPNSSTGTVSGTDSKLNSTVYDLKLGYNFPDSIYAGLIYDTTGYDNGGSWNPKRSLTGVTLGYHNMGFFLDLSYFLLGQISDKFVSGDQLSSPSGFGFDFGYNEMMGESFYLGVQLSYKAITFSKYAGSASANEVSTTWKQTELYPMLSLGFMF